jgi:fermentation-respiration switch protein FrsA (DUF1100 family)
MGAVRQQEYKMVKDFPELDVPIPMLTIKRTMEHIPEDYLSQVKVPLHITGAEKDAVNPLAESQSIFDKANDQKEFYTVPKATHYEIYEGALFEDVSKRQMEWFKKYL